MSVFGELWGDAKRDTGDVIDGGAHLIGDGLNLIGAHGAAQWVDTEGTKLGYDLGADVPELQLGQTSDPKELVHGDPAAIRSAASKLRTFSSAFGETADGLRGIDTGHWEGSAADAFRAKFAIQPAKWSEASQAMGKTAGALESYAGAVESAQARARQAIELWEQGQQATAQAAASYNQQVTAYNSAAQAYNARLAAGQNPGTRPSQPGPFSDPGEALREEARQVLASARTARDGAAASAAAAITAAAGMAPATPSLWSQLGDDLSDTFQAGNLASVSFSSGVLEGVADIVKFARSVNPEDPWNLEHPAEYAAGISGTLAGLADAAMNPADLVKGVFGTGWGSDPAQALGKLVPNVALAVATDGGGTAADVGASAAEDAGVSLGEDSGTNAAENAASRSTGDMTRVGDPVDVATGDVVLAQTDVSLPGLLPLALERAHRSSQRAGRWFGESWMSSLDQRILVTSDRVAAVFADGQVLLYRRDDLDGDHAGTVLPDAGPAWPLWLDPDGSYVVTDPQRGLTWRFSARPGFWRYVGGQGELPLVSVTDRAGHAVSFDYDESGQPSFVTHSGGYRVSVTVTEGRVTGLAFGDVSLVRYEYHDSGSLAAVVNSSGQPLRLSYDDAGRLTGWTDRNGHSYQYSYDELGRCAHGESPSGALSGSYSYGPGVTRWTNAVGSVTEYSIDRSARVAAITDSLGNVTRFVHDARGRVTARTDPLGRTTQYAYDALGNLAAVTRPDGGVARAEHDDRCLPVAVTEADGVTWRQAFDASGNLTSLTAPDGSATRYEYDTSGHLASVTGPDGSVTTVTCDAAGLPVTVTRPDNRTTRYERDQFGRIGLITDPAGAATLLTWTIEGRPLSRTLPDGSAETWAWDAEGSLARHTSPAGAVTSYEYGAFDKPVAVTRPDGTRTSFGYDHELRLTSVVHGGLTWRYAYDPAGRVIEETDYNGAVTRYWHDAAGQLIRRINAARHELTFTYDALGNLVEETDSDGAVATFGYDDAGRLVLARNASAAVEFSRDPLGRVTAETCDGRTVTTSYDAAGRVTGRITSSGATTAWTYDEAGLPTAMTSGGHELRFGYRADGREISRSLPGGLTLAQDWDALGRLTGQVLEGPTAGGQVLQRRGYTYDPDGFVTGIEDLFTGSRAFGLDASGRVTTVNGAEWIERYAYDPAGNLASATWPSPPPGVRAPWLEDGPQGAREVTGTLITRAGNIRYRHDAAGRVVARTRTRISRKPETWRYEWDANDRLAAVTTPDGTMWRYRYDALGRRVGKQHVGADGSVLSQTRFTWDGVVLVEQSETVGAADTLSAREQVTTWGYRPGTFTPLTQMTRASLRDAPQEVIDERFYAIITDLTGMPCELVTPDGTLAGYQQHTLWGNTLWHPSGESTPLRFPGQYADPETGLHYNNHRYYDPVTGAYLSPDPLGLSPAPNPHAYVDNPHVLIDPLGLAADDSYGAGGSAAEVPALPAGSPGSVIANALEPHEIAQAQSIVGLRGGTFIGNTLKSAPGIDGTLDGAPVSLKAYSGSSPAGVLRYASAAERSAANAGYSGVQVYIDAQQVATNRLLDFGLNSPLSQIPHQGIISSIYVNTTGGWVIFPG